MGIPFVSFPRDLHICPFINRSERQFFTILVCGRPYISTFPQEVFLHCLRGSMARARVIIPTEQRGRFCRRQAGPTSAACRPPARGVSYIVPSPGGSPAAHPGSALPAQAPPQGIFSSKSVSLSQIRCQFRSFLEKTRAEIELQSVLVTSTLFMLYWSSVLCVYLTTFVVLTWENSGESEPNVVPKKICCA